MRAAIIGAGLAGVCSALELAQAGHEVTVFERHGSVAEEASFAPSGVRSVAHVAAWVVPGQPGYAWPTAWWPWGDTGDRLEVLKPLSRREARWHRRRTALARDGLWAERRQALWQLVSETPDGSAGLMAGMMAGVGPATLAARHSPAEAWAAGQPQQVEQTHGLLLLLRDEQELARIRAELKLLTDWGVPLNLVDAARARVLEPGLRPDTGLHAAVHLPEALQLNARQWAQALRLEAEAAGASFRFSREVVQLEAGDRPAVQHRLAARLGGGGEASGQDPAGLQQDHFDAVVVAAAAGAVALVQPLGVKLPVVAVHGQSLSAQLREFEGVHALGPRAGLVDTRHQVVITRIGQRLRVAGLATLGGEAAEREAHGAAVLHQVLDDWFPACLGGPVQRWSGSRLMAADGLPLIGPSGVAGIWLNTAHGDLGAALAPGAARRIRRMVQGGPARAAQPSSDPDRPLALDRPSVQ